MCDVALQFGLPIRTRKQIYQLHLQNSFTLANYKIPNIKCGTKTDLKVLKFTQ